MPSRKYAVLRTALLSHNKNWPLCFHKKDADDGKKSNDLMSLQPKWDKNSCCWLNRFSRGHLVGSDSHQPTLFLQLHEKPQLIHFEIKRNHPREPEGLKRLAVKAKSFPFWMHKWKVHVSSYLLRQSCHYSQRLTTWACFKSTSPLTQDEPHPYRPNPASFLLRAEGLSLNSILLEWLTAFLEVALKKCVFVTEP